VAIGGINDWYANAEGRSWDKPEYDWENDDPPDRTPDSWLDRYTAKLARAPQDPPRGRRTTGGLAAGVSVRLRAIAKAAREMRVAEPRLSDKTIARRLRERGWNVTGVDVRKALGHKVPQPAAGRQAPPLVSPSARSRRGGQSPSTIANAARPTDIPSLLRIAKAAYAMRTIEPSLGDKAIARRLRERGWNVTKADVRKALGHKVPQLTAVPQPTAGRQAPPVVFRSAESLPGGQSPSTIPNEAGPADIPSLPQIAKAAYGMRAIEPWLSDKSVALRLRERGWNVTEADVREALGKKPVRSTRGRSTVPRRTKKRGTQDLPVRRGASSKRRSSSASSTRVALCPSCGVAVSIRECKVDGVSP
jgi:hypothetical protein